MLVEEFQRCVNEDIKIYLHGQKVDNLTTAAVTADEYALDHRSKHNFKGHSKMSNSQNRQFSNPSQQNSGAAKKQPDSNRNKSDGNTNVDSKIPTCAYCRKPGHLMSKCFKLAQKKKKEGETSSNALTVVERPPQDVVNNHMPDSDMSDKIKEEYLPFISEGFVSLSGDSSDQQPIKIKVLRDTGATQSLLLEGVLPLSEQTSTGANVLIQGVECGFISVPLHRICLKSDLVSGDVTVGIRPTLPVKGVSFLLGNDLAGEKVVASQNFSTNPSNVDNTEQLQKEISNSCPFCDATRKRV